MTHAFTLLELLLAVTIFSIVALTLYGTFYSGVRILRSSEKLMRRHQDLRLVTDQLALDLRNTLLARLADRLDAPASTEDGEEEESIYFFKGDVRSFNFITQKSLFSETGKNLQNVCDVTYYFEAKDGGALMRKVRYQSQGFKAQPGADERLLGDIEDVEVLYSYQGEGEEDEPVWFNFWELEEMVPLGVKLRLRLKGLGRTRLFTKTIFIPVGRLGSTEEEEETSL